MYIDHMYDRLRKKGAILDVDDDAGGSFDSRKVALRLMQVEAATVQGNCSLALRLLKATRQVGANCSVFNTVSSISVFCFNFF